MRDFSAYGSTSAWAYSRVIDPLLRALRDKITAICGANGITDAIDIACATGGQCRSLHRAGVITTGVDLSPEMIAAATRIGPPDIRYIVGSALELPFPAGRFTGAILSLCLHEHPAPEREGMIREAVRVVRPGGAVILAEYSPPPRWNFTWGFINLIEWMAGKEHFRNFREFVKAGGIRAVEPYIPPPKERHHLFQGTIEILVGRKV